MVTQGRTVIKVSSRVHKELMRIKEREGHTSIDSVLRQLIAEAKESEKD